MSAGARLPSTDLAGGRRASAARHLLQRLRRCLLCVLVLAVVAAGAGYWVLRANLDRLLFPHAELTGPVKPQEVWLVPGNEGDGSALLMRRFGVPVLGCVVFFPGQHGGVADYAATLFPPLLARGAAVYSVSYPGQDSAPGHPRLHELRAMAARAIEETMQRCAPMRTVVLGRSLGAMVAVYGAAAARPAGLVLEGTPASLSDAVSTFMRARWWMRPLAALPVSALLPDDPSLAEALGQGTDFPVTIFQGTHDERTPLASLQHAELPPQVRLRVVEEGTHFSTWQQAGAAFFDTVVAPLLEFTAPAPEVAKR